MHRLPNIKSLVRRHPGGLFYSRSIVECIVMPFMNSEPGSIWFSFILNIYILLKRKQCRRLRVTYCIECFYVNLFCKDEPISDTFLIEIERTFEK